MSINVENDVQISTGKWLLNGPKTGPTLLLAHGAGAGMDSEFMDQFSNAIGKLGASVVRFEFPYMQLRRTLQSKRPPDRAPKLINHFHLELKALMSTNSLDGVFIGGKSMGGRMASMLLSERSNLKVRGVVALGYPFHPPSKPEQLRTEHLMSLAKPMLICQGTGDKLGNQDEVLKLDLPPDIDIEWLEDGDHDLKPRVRSGYTHSGHIEKAAHAVWQFIKS